MRDKTIRATGATIILLGVVVAALTQLKVGGDPSAISITTPATTSTLTPEETQTTVEQTFTYRVGVLSGITTDNFWAFYGGRATIWDAYILGPTKPALYTLDPTSGELVPELATAIAEPVADKQSWTVTVDLDPDMSWSDGAPITADDFVFTFETVRAMGLKGSWRDVFPDEVDNVSAPSAHTVVIEFTERPNLGVWPHSTGLAPVMPSHVWEDRIAGLDRKALYDMEASFDVGGGRLALSEVGEGQVVSVANPGYPSQGVDRVEYYVYGDEADALAALDAGDVDTVLNPKGLTPQEVDSIADNTSVAITSSPANGVRYLGFNLSRAPMSEPAFRRALALLLDRKDMAKTLGSSVADTFVPTANGRWFDAETAEGNADLYGGSLAERLDRALEGLREAGYTWGAEPSLDEEGAIIPGKGLMVGGLPVAPLTILTPGDAWDPSRPGQAAMIAETLGWLGFEARPVETDFDTVVDIAFTPGEDDLLHYDMYLLGWTLGDPTLPVFYGDLFGNDGEMNNTGYSSAAFDEQLSAFEGSYDLNEARQAVQGMERTLARDLPYLLLYSTSIVEAYRWDRVEFGVSSSLGGLQGRLGGVGDVAPADVGNVAG